MMFFGWAILVILVDQISKFYIQSTMVIGESFPVIKGIFHITYIENTHTAFGLFKYQNVFFIIAAIISLVLVILIYKKIIFEKNPKMHISLLLILGGALGNLFDRIRIEGRVIDFLDFQIWPVFNFADMCIVCGMFIMLIYFLFISEKRKEE